MQIERIKISGFRSFGAKPVRVNLADDLTCFIGPNASGKTALLQALTKMFGVTRAQRTVARSDFHLPPDVDPNDRSARSLYIDVLISFPELAEGKARPETVAPCFKHMCIERPKQPPVCRLRLEAAWEDDGTVGGEVSQELYWINTLDAKIKDEQKHKVLAPDRGLIQLYYTPASRDAGAQIRATTGALAARLLRAIEWSSGTQAAVQSATQELTDAFESEEAIKSISKALARRWADLHDEKTDTKPKLALLSRRFEEVVGKINVVFEQAPAEIERGLEALSDGQQSLFYFALAAAVFDLEREAVAGKVEGFRSEDLSIPALTIFAIEEPENHLSPYYLARIVQQVRSVVSSGGAQAILTSHSPAVLSRVQPEEVRYCRLDADTRLTSVSAVTLPEEDEEAEKFVRSAVLAFPELYFARFVVLVEGDSERVVLPRLAKAIELLIDPAFVAIVPLGGRHVQHFWRLLDDLGIPHATLLDLDLGRAGGGYGRVKTAIEQLLEIGADRDELLSISGGGVLDAGRFAQMHTWDSSKLDKLKGWVSRLERYGVFFSYPLDLDLAMLAAFPDAYEAIVPTGGGPKMTVEKAAEVVLGTGGPGLGIYAGEIEELREYMPSYRYHFMTHSKPATHLRALVHLTDKALKKGTPQSLGPLLDLVKKDLRRD